MRWMQALSVATALLMLESGAGARGAAVCEDPGPDGSSAPPSEARPPAAAPAPPRAAPRGETHLASVASYGKAGQVRMVLAGRSLSGKAGDVLPVRIVNEGQEVFEVRAGDVWTAVLRGGARVPLARQLGPGEKKVPPVRLVEPLRSEMVALRAPEGASGEIAALELASGELGKTMIAKDAYEPPRPNLVVPPRSPAGSAAALVGAEEVSAAVVVGPDGRVVSVTVLPDDRGEAARPELADAVTVAVRKWTFEPAMRNGTAERAVYERTLRFSARRVVRRVFGSPAKELEPRLARYLHDNYPWVVDIPSARGFAVAARPWKKKGIRGADAWLMRIGDTSPTQTWVAVTSLTLLVRESPLGSNCECYWWASQDDGARDFMDLLAARLDLTAVQAEVLAPQEGVLIPSGLLEPEEAGRWSRSSVRRLLGVSFATILGKNKKKAALAGVLAQLDPSQPPPAAAEFLPRPPSGSGGSAAPVDPYRVGDDVTAPVLIRRVNPKYPEVTKAEHVQGRVLLEATIDSTGTVTELEILRGIAGLNVSSVDAVCCWRYRPATKNGQPVSVYYPVYLEYGLR